ncbi:MAG: hypothetical protein ABIQ67_10215 [Sphingomicrobium sp.]
MVDEIFDRGYQTGRDDLNAGLDRAFNRIGGAIGNSLKALHRIEWNAPWASAPKDSQCG